MKKLILLAFILVANQSILGQVTANMPDPLQVCDDEDSGSPYDEISVFDLTVVEPEVIGAQDPSNLEIGYFETLSEADLNINAISDPTQYLNVLNPQSVYIRLTNIVTAEYDITTVDLVVYPIPTPTSPTPLIACDNDADGFALFDLSSKDAEIIQGEPNVSVLYFETLQNAVDGMVGDALASPYQNIEPFFQTVYARVTRDVPPEPLPCYEIVELELQVTPLPDEPSSDFLDPIVICNDGGLAIFDLTINDPAIIGVQDPGDIFITHHVSMADANNAVNAISNPQNYSSSGETVWFRSENVNTSCYIIGSVELVVEIGCPIIEIEPEDIFVNEGDGDGLAIFDLTIFEAQMLGSQDPLVFLFSYHIAFSDANLGINAIDTPMVYQNIANPQTIYVRLTNSNTGTFTQTDFKIETDGILSLNDYTENVFSVYPNPTNDSVYLETGNSSMKFIVALYDAGGRKVLEAANSNQLQLSGLQEGMYFLKISTENFSEVKRVIKN